jgi:hypothetical protein
MPYKYNPFSKELDYHEIVSDFSISEAWFGGNSFTRVSGSSFTVTDDSDNQLKFKVGRPIRYRQSGGTWYYGIITDYSSGTVTIAGYPLGVSDDEIQFGPTSRVQQLDINIPGLFADAADTDLVLNDLATYIQWRLGNAYLARISHRVVSADTGASQPRVNVSIGGTQVCTTNSNEGRDVSTSWVHTTVDIDTDYAVSIDDDIEITTDANGTNNDAEDLSVSCTFVLE